MKTKNKNLKINKGRDEMKTKKQIQKELEKLKTLYIAHTFAYINEGDESAEIEFLSKWITNNCKGWNEESCAERIVTLQWVIDCERKLPKIGSYKLEEFVETLKA